MLLLIDNYDSFTYNLFQYLSELGADVASDEVTTSRRLRNCLRWARKGWSSHQVRLIPRNAGISIDAIKHFAGKIPVLGVCLGHQAIGEAFGGIVDHAGELKHGKTSMIEHDGKGVFEGLPNPFEAVRYHSLAVQADAVPSGLRGLSTVDGERCDHGNATS